MPTQPVQPTSADPVDAAHADAAVAPALAPAPPVPRTVRPALRLATGAVAFAALFAVLYLLLVVTEAGQQLENLGLEGSALRTRPSQDDSLLGLESVSAVSFGIAIVVLAGVAVLRRRPHLALATVLAMGGSAVLAQLLKGLLPRPEFADLPAWLLRNSFPSGHATVAAAVGAGILMVAPARLRWIALPLAATETAIVGQATQVAGWHRASDALGGVLLVLAVSAGTLALLAVRGLVAPEERGAVHRRIHQALVVAALLILATAGVLLVLPLLFPLLRAPEGAEGAFVHLGMGLAAASATLLAVDAFGRLLEPLAPGIRVRPAIESPAPGTPTGTP